MKYVAFAASVVLSFLGLAYAPAAQAQASCSTTYDSTKKFCAAVDPQEWEWYWHLGGFSEHGPFNSESGALAHLVAFTLGPTGSGQSWCDMTLDHKDTDASPVISNGMPREYDYNVHYNVTKFKDAPVPCQRHNSNCNCLS